MKNKKRKLIIFDIEVLENFFICGVKPVKGKIIIFEISHRRNDLEKLVDYFLSHDKDYFIGYNCDFYDEPVLYNLIKKYHEADPFWHENYLSICGYIKEVSDMLIERDKPEFRKKRLVRTIDLMTMLFSNALRTGLKSLQVSMCYPNVEEMNIDWNKWLPTEDMDMLISYNHNDLNSTEFLFNLLKPDLELRKTIKKTYGIECLSRDGVGTGVAIFTKYVCNELGLLYPSHLKNFVVEKPQHPVSELLLPQIEFRTKPFKEVHEKYKSLILTSEGGLPEHMKKKGGNKGRKGAPKIEGEDDGMFEAISNGLKHSFGLGGIHSVNTPNIYQSCKDYVLIDADVASMYPSMCLQWGFGPSGFLKAFQSTMWKIYNQRLEAKAKKDKIVDKTMKLVLNSILGNLKQAYSAYYAPEANASICINGQLFLAMLIERLEAVGIKCVMSNTDGITCLIHRSKLIQYYMICDEWMELSRMVLEFVTYEKMVIRSVNDYVAFTEGYTANAGTYDFPNPEDILEYNFAMLKNTEDGEKMQKYQKQKGKSFITYPRVGKGLNSLIVPKAIINYFGRGIPIEETIRNVKSIYDYVMYQKVGKQFKVMHGDKEVQHISRFHADPSKPLLRKVSSSGKTGAILSGYGVNLVNDLRDSKLEDFNINFKYYIRKANEIISEIELRTNQIDLFSSNSQQLSLL